MKKTKFYSFLLVAVLAITSVSYLNSCKTDPCKNVTCNNGGTCVEGTCSCLTGYEGTGCETEVRTKMLGSYVGTQIKNSGTASSSVGTIETTSAAVSNVLITGVPVGFFTAKVTASVSSSAITIASQQPDSDGYSISGSGTYSSTGVSFTYSITGPDSNGNMVTDNYSTTWTKQ